MPRATNRMQAIMFDRKPGLRSEYALSMGKRARTYHYQHRQENTPATLMLKAIGHGENSRNVSA